MDVHDNNSSEEVADCNDSGDEKNKDVTMDKAKN